MIVGQTMLAEAEIRLLDVKCHVSISRGQDFQIDDVRIADSVSTDMISSDSTESSRFDSVGSSVEILDETVLQSSEAEFVPTIRSGSSCDVGSRDSMDDEHICIDDLSAHLGSSLSEFSTPTAFYAVFDGHGGPEAALYIKENAMRLLFEDAEFPQIPSVVDGIFLKQMEDSHRRAFLLADLAMADESVVSGSCGTTALTALVVGRHLVVANAGDCRAVLCRKGVAIDMSFDHRSTFLSERNRVEALGGFFDDGYLNGVISVTRALGDWEMKLPQGSPSPLISDPDVQHIVLTEEEEFLILGCDGIWDVMSSQYAVSLVRQMLRKYDDPTKCATELVNEALRLNSLDNLTVVVICFSSSPPSSQRRRLSRFRSLCEESRSQLQKFLGED